MKKAAYHHGDLRAALIDAGLTLIAERDVGEVSLREVARSVGVSAPAVYRHFPDKGALMHALAIEGFDRLAAAQHAASDQAGGGAKGFNATGRTYVKFALANPALFRLMFSRPAAQTLLGGKESGAHEAMAFLLANAEALAPPGADAGTVRVIALRAWAVAHGIAMLMLDGQAPNDPDLVDRVVDTGPPF